MNICLLDNYVAPSRLIAVLFILLPLGSVELNRVSSVFSVPSKQLRTVDSDSPKAHLLTQLKILLEPVFDPGLSPLPCWAYRGPSGLTPAQSSSPFFFYTLPPCPCLETCGFWQQCSSTLFLFYFRKLLPLSVPFFPAPYLLFVRFSLQDLLECWLSHLPSVYGFCSYVFLVCIHVCTCVCVVLAYVGLLIDAHAGLASWNWCLWSTMTVVHFIHW